MVSCSYSSLLILSFIGLDSVTSGRQNCKFQTTTTRSCFEMDMQLVDSQVSAAALNDCMPCNLELMLEVLGHTDQIFFLTSSESTFAFLSA